MSDVAPEPNPQLVAHWMHAEAVLEAERPTGDPGSIRCSVPTHTGACCGRGRFLVGDGRVLMCPTCDGPGEGFRPAWLDPPSE